MERFMFCTDTHGDMIDPGARKAALMFRDLFKPDVRIDGGDIFDFRSLRKNATDDERRESVELDVKAGESWINDYCPTHALLGNHDHRLWEASETCGDGNRVMFYRQLIDSIMDCFYLSETKVFPYDVDLGVFQYGDTAFLHGYHHSMHSAYKLAMEFGNSVMGHVHQFQESPARNRFRHVGRTCGCMCKLHLDYNRRRAGTFRWAQGFMYGWKTEEDHVIIRDIRPFPDGTWVLPTRFDDE